MSSEENRGSVTRMAAGVARKLTGKSRPPAPGTEGTSSQLDRWLEPLFGQALDRIEASIDGQDPAQFSLFRDLDDDVWALLLTKEYEGWPKIRALLPDLPEPALQQMWNGASGPPLAAQGVCFYRKLKVMQARHGQVPLGSAKVLDFGCGWGRLTRMLARDLESGALFGCDPVEDILEVCRSSRVPATLARSDFLPRALPFKEKFDLAFAFSVFTHVSEAAHLASLDALHRGLAPGGLLVVTVRPPAYVDLNPLIQPVVDRLGPDRRRVLEEPRYIFLPHDTDGHPQYDEEADDPMSYGDTVITLPYIREQWTPMFELLDVSLMTGDMYQTTITLKKR